MLKPFADLQKTFHKSGTVTKVQKDMITQWPIERKYQLDSRGATRDPSCSLPSTLFDGWYYGRHILHVKQWETHFTCEMQVSLNDTTVLVSEFTVFDKYHATCFACACVYIGCITILVNIPQKVIVVESRKWDTIPKSTLFRLERAPGNGLACFCVVHTTQTLSLHWQ